LSIVGREILQNSGTNGNLQF